MCAKLAYDVIAMKDLFKKTNGRTGGET